MQAGSRGRGAGAGAGRHPVVRQLLTAMRHAGPVAARSPSWRSRYRDQGVVGFDIAGAEAGYPPTRHLDAFEYLQRENAHFTIHAGEAFGLPSIWQAIQWCGADRLGHGVRIIDDISLVGEATRSSAGWPPTSATAASRWRCARPPTCRPAPHHRSHRSISLIVAVDRHPETPSRDSRPIGRWRSTVRRRSARWRPTAHLQRDALVAHVGGQPAEVRYAVGAGGHVVDDPHAVPEPVRAAPLDRLPDRRQPEPLAGVDGEVRVLPLEVLDASRCRVGG